MTCTRFILKKESLCTSENGGAVDGERIENPLRERLPVTLVNDIILKILRFEQESTIWKTFNQSHCIFPPVAT